MVDWRRICRLNKRSIESSFNECLMQASILVLSVYMLEKKLCFMLLNSWFVIVGYIVSYMQHCLQILEHPALIVVFLVHLELDLLLLVCYNYSGMRNLIKLHMNQ
ncbi:hypothetical protein R6Q59_021189 [Mikania micrantha]